MNRVVRPLLSLVAALALTVVGLAGPAATATKLTLTGANSVAKGAVYTAKVQLSPKQKNVSITLVRLVMGGSVKVAAAKTSATGLATFRFKVASTSLTLRANLTNKKTVVSNTKKVTVSSGTKVTAVWPDWVGCSAEIVGVNVTPATAGRRVELQWWKNSTGEWVTEDSSTTDSSGYAEVQLDSTDSGGTYQQRIWVPASGGLTAGQSDWVDIEFDACVAEFDLSATSTTATELAAGSYYGVSWEVSGWDAESWVNDDAYVVFEVCNDYYGDCDATDPDMAIWHEELVTIYGDDSGNFYWYTEAGDYRVRISVWDDGEMLYYVTTTITVY